MEEPVSTSNKLVKMLGIILPLVLVSLLLGICLSLAVYRRRRKAKTEVSQHDNLEEIMPLTEQTDGFKAKKAELVKQLNEAYKKLYNNVQPNPINRATKFSVEQLYVEGGMEMETLKDGRYDPKALGSYHDMFNNDEGKPQRIIVESRPGFGKSFLTLMFAYDWCNKIPSSPLGNIDILIILQLRKMESIESLYQGIRQTLLPQYTSLSEADVKAILSPSTGTSILIVLDGYGEYENKYNGETFGINNIISGRMFESFNVVLTTRTPHFPKKVAHETKTIRLTGFTDKTRQKYVEKVVGSGSVMNFGFLDIVLEEYDEVRELCSIPMYWVMFVHMYLQMYQEKNDEFLSVTSVLRCIVSSLQHHVNITLGNENSKEVYVLETGHQIINEVAYKIATSVDENYIIPNSFIEQLDDNTFKQFICSGILVEIDKEAEQKFIADQSSKTGVKFQCPIFAYWYAANFLVKVVCHDTSGAVEPHLLKEDKPSKFAVVCRLACGIEGSNSSKVYYYTRNLTSSEQFLFLCFLERSRCLSEVKGTINSVCKTGLIISGHDSLLEQKSTLQLTKIAGSAKIAITKLVLHDCIKEITKDTCEIITESQLKISSKLLLLSLVVFSRNRDLTDEETKEVLQFSRKCAKLAILEFTAGVPPMKFEDGFLRFVSTSKNLKVRWRARSTSSPYILNMKSGKWENQDNHTELTEDDVGKALLLNKQDREKFTEEDYKKELQRYRETLRKNAADQSTNN